MSRLAVPLLYRTLWATGDVLVRPVLILHVKDNVGTWQPLRLLVDSGSEMTTVPAYRARQFNLPMPRQAAPGVKHQQTGLEIRSGNLRARVAGMDATEYVFPCFFLGDPTHHTVGGPPGATPRLLLGLSGVVDKLRLCFDGDSLPAAPYGNLIVEKR